MPPLKKALVFRCTNVRIMNPGESKAVTDLVPDLIWAPDFFGPQKVWAPRNLGPNKFDPCIKMLYNDIHAEPKFHGDQISWGPNFLGTKKSQGPK